MSPEEKYADKISKLLRKAESTDSPSEAEALVSKAQALMREYAITEAMVQRARGEADAPAEQIIEEDIVYTGVYQAPFLEMGIAITRANGCRPIMGHAPYGKRQKVLHAVGFEGDVELVKMLDSSLQVQATAAMTKWWAEQDGSWMSASQRHKAKRGFLFGFADGLRAQLIQAQNEGEKAAAEAEAERSGSTEDEAKESVALVVRERKDQVNDWIDKKYGKLRKGVARGYDSGGIGARSAGHAAGRSADTSTGGDRIGGSARELGSGS